MTTNFNELFRRIREESRQAAASGICVSCKTPFSEANTHSQAGWRETQISGLCEDCFDEACPDDEGDEDDNAATY